MSRLHVIYAYYEKDDNYRLNLIYFLKHGVYPKDPMVDYTLVVNGSHSVVFPSEPNVKVILRENTGYDFQGYYVGILSQKKQYDYYLFLNSSVRGPYLPPYSQSYFRWYQPYLDLLKGSVKLVGSTINIQTPTEKLKLTQLTPHVQSYCFAMGQECLTYLMGTNLFRQEYSNKLEVIIHQEIMMSTLVLQKGWNLSCLVPEYQRYNYHLKNAEMIKDDILWEKNALGRILHPYEVIFMKTDRDISINEMACLTDISVEEMSYAPMTEKKRSLAVCFHLGYGHLYPSFKNYIQNVYRTGYTVDLYVTYQKHTDPIYLIKKDYPHAIMIQTTRGCDTGAFLLQLERINQSGKNYDYIFKIHTKKREDWRLELLKQLADSPENVINICQTFERDPTVGMITGSPKWIHHHDRTNEPLINEICQRLHVTLNQQSLFVGGTIFWVRWSTMKKFISSQVNLRKEYELCELGYLLNDKPTYTHSWERIFGYLVCHYNQKIISVLTQPSVPSGSLITFPSSQKGCQISQVWYGLSEKESINVTEIIKKKSNLNLRTINTNAVFGDPYPEKKKKLIIKLTDKTTIFLNECSARVTPNNWVLKSLLTPQPHLIIEIEPCDNFENWIRLKHHDQLGFYSTTFFDWSYYYTQHSPWLMNQTYQECLLHYHQHGIQSGLLPFKCGESLLTKYKIKLMAYYQPQYDPNFSKSWKPLYRTHQIKIPPASYSPNIRKQVEQAKQVGLSGFCFLHEWPKTESDETVRILTTSGDEILKKTGFEFCFQWLTESVLSDSNDWIHHFSYLLPFFRHPQYYKINHQPVFLMPHSAQTEAFVSHWKQLAIDAGFSGIFFVNQITTATNPRGGAVTLYDYPKFQTKTPKSLLSETARSMMSLDYCRLCHQLVNEKRQGEHYFRSVMTGYDNSANSQEKVKIVCEGFSPKGFYCELQAQIENILEQPNPHGVDNTIMIQSWNDWKNQMCLESNPELMEVLINLGSQYSHPQIYNRNPDLFY